MHLEIKIVKQTHFYQKNRVSKKYLRKFVL